MATISITVPDTLVPRIVAAMRSQFPEYAALTDAACFKQITADNWRRILADYESRAAGATAMTDGAGIG